MTKHLAPPLEMNPLQGRVALATRRETIRLARRLAPALGASDLVVLDGDLGTGKTFFVRALLRALGVPHEIQVTSPTFTLVHEYVAASCRVLHADAYRLGSVSEMEALGLREARQEGAVVFLEWGSPMIDALGGDALLLSLEARGEHSTARSVQITGTGRRGAWLAATLLTEAKRANAP